MNMAQRVIRESGLLHYQLARDSGLSREAFHMWIRGTRQPRAESLERLADGLEYRAGILMDLADQIRKEIDNDHR